MVEQSFTLDFDEVDAAASGRCTAIIAALTTISSDSLTKGGVRGNDHQCPLCGHGSFFVDGDVNDHGRVNCHRCDIHTGGIRDTVVQFGRFSNHNEAARAIAEYIGIWSPNSSDSPRQTPKKIDIVESVARAKRMPLDAFRLFGVKAATRGRDRTPVARVSAYDGTGEVHSYFDLTPSDKGKFKPGEGNHGMFFPGRLPAPGETWHVVEGVKDAAALAGMGYLAAGLPTSHMNSRFARLFAGVDVIMVPDLDAVGQTGAHKSAARLAGIAASVRIARIPGEITATSGDDVRDVLRLPDGEQAIRDAIANAVEWVPRDDDATGDARTEVVLTPIYSTHVDQVAECIGRLGFDTPWVPEKKRDARKVYRNCGRLVGIVSRDDGTPAIVALDRSQLVIRIPDACRVVVEKANRRGENERHECPPPRWLYEGLAAEGPHNDAIKRLDGVVTCPTLRPDGSILQTPGYDAATQLEYRPTCEFPRIADSPSREQSAAAARELVDVVSDFPFLDDADRSAWLSLVLSMVGRYCVDGCVPLFAVTANAAGSGKGRLVDIASIITHGVDAPRIPRSRNDDEGRKLITSLLAEGASTILFDNVDEALGSAALDAALTSGRWRDRELNATGTIDVEVKAIWVATGNGLSFKGDMSRRVLPIRLQTKEERPSDRTDFRRTDILRWTRDHRAELVTAALTILRGYFAAGRPEQPGGAWGSYESWTATVRGAIVWAGLPDPLTTRKSAIEHDQTAATLTGLIAGLLEMDATGDGLTAAEICRRLNSRGDDLDDWPHMRTVVEELIGKPDARRLGNQLRVFRDRVANKCRIDGRTGKGGFTYWRVVSAGDSGDSENGAGESANRPESPKKCSVLSSETVKGDSGDSDIELHREGLRCVTKTANATQRTSISGSPKPESPESPARNRCEVEV